MAINQPVSEILGRNPGAKVTKPVVVPPELASHDYKIPTGQTIDVSLIRIPDGIATLIDDCQLNIAVKCDRCLKPYQQSITINNIERIFYLQEPEEALSHDYQLIDPYPHQINLEPLLIEAVELSLPSNFHCQTDCPGIKLNRDQPSQTTKPFKKLLQSEDN